MTHVKNDEAKRNESENNQELSQEKLDQVHGGAVDYFLEMDGIQGESQDDNFKDTLG